MYACAQNGKHLGSDLDTLKKIFMKSQDIQRLCRAEGVSRTYICTCSNREKKLVTHTEQSTSNTLGYLEKGAHPHRLQ